MMCAIAMESARGGSTRVVKKTGCNLAGDGPGSIVSKAAVSKAFANRGWCCQDRYVHAMKNRLGLMSREIFASGSHSPPPPPPPPPLTGLMSREIFASDDCLACR